MKRKIAGGMGLVALAAMGGLSGAARADSDTTFYGFLNPAFVQVDDGGASQGKLSDNSHAPSRFGFWTIAPLRNGTVSFNFETALGFRGTGGVSQGVALDPWKWRSASIRKLEVKYETANGGTFWFGQGSMASDGVATKDLSGTGLVSAVGVGDTAGAYRFRDTGGALSAVTISSAFRNLDGGRRTRLRYDTPEFGGGFTFSVAAGAQLLIGLLSERDIDMGLGYRATMGDVKIAAGMGVAYTNFDTLPDQSRVSGSLSVLHTPSGVSGTFALGTRFGNSDGSYGYAKLGITRDWMSWGATSLSVDYYRSMDMAGAGSEAESIGIGIVQKIDAAKTEVYAGYHTHGFSDTSPTAYQDIDAVMFGARWKF